jgi:hypothetical protein
MSNNIFSGKRFRLLFKQHFIHHSQFLLLSTVAYTGVVFIVLSLVQVGNDLQPHDLEKFQGFLVAFVTVFGVLYVGHSFPAFRSKESTISYLMMPASALEKFVFELVSRIGIILVTLPLLYWVIFHLQGYLFEMFSMGDFEAVGIRHLVTIDDNVPALIYVLVASGILFALSLAFTGSAMFTRQPLVKSLFAVAVTVMLFLGYSYIVIVHLGVGQYNPPDSMVLFPMQETAILRFMTIVCFVGTAVMLFVAFQKLKEREI